VAVGKKYNGEHLFMDMHKDYITKYPHHSEMHEYEVEEFERNLRWLQAIFYKSKPINKTKAATIASYKSTEILGKKSPFSDANVITESLVVVGDSLFNDLQRKLKYAMQLSRFNYLEVLPQESRIMSDDAEHQLWKDL
jgi:hypothetical protein